MISIHPTCLNDQPAARVAGVPDRFPPTEAPL